MPPLFLYVSGHSPHFLLYQNFSFGVKMVYISRLYAILCLRICCAATYTWII